MIIWKYTLTIKDRQTIYVPRGAKLLTVQMQPALNVLGEQPQLWLLCDETADKEARELAIYGTGNPITSNPGSYIATFQSHGGTMVWHLFELSDDTAK